MRRSGDSRRTVGVRELKARAAGIVREVRESRVAYTLTHRGRAIGVILPLEPEAPGNSEGTDGVSAWNTFVEAGRRLESGFRPGVGGVRLLSKSRR
jgi:prevent-host-death family protein